MEVVRSRFGDDVDYPSRRAPEFRIGAACHYLELLHRIQSNIDRRALPALLLSEESVVVVATVQAHVIKDSTLAIEGDLVAVGALRDADAGGQSKQVFKLAAEHRRGAHRKFIQRRRRFRLRDFHNWHVGNDNLLRDRRNFHRHRQSDRLPDSEVHIFLHDGGEPRFVDGEGIAPWRKAQKGKMSVRVGDICLYEIGV